MNHRIEIALKAEVPDARGEGIRERARKELGIELSSVRTINVYTIGFEMDREQLAFVAEELLLDKVTEEYSIDRPLAEDFDVLCEKSFRPGVTDNIGKTAGKIIRLCIDRQLGEDDRVFSSVQYLFKHASEEEARMIAERILGNELIERFVFFTKDRYKDPVFPLPIVSQDAAPEAETIPLARLSDEDLVKLSKGRCLALNLEEMKALKDHFSDKGFMEFRKSRGLSDITDVELETIAQTWSEHCKHKEFNATVNYTDHETGKSEKIDGLFHTYIKKSTEEIKKSLKKDYLVKIFNDNAGIVRYDDSTNLVFKVETHNSPSALDPYGGAITGIVGVNRDPAGTGRTGAKPLFNTDVFCFGSPFYDNELPPDTKHPMQIFEGVHRGVRDGGNQSGIPTLNGSLYFDDRYMGKPLVYCGTAGLMPAKIEGVDTSAKEISAGDIAIMVGGRVGKDGIHGATMSSEERHSGTPVTAVQIGDAITQKVMLDFIWEIKDKGWIKAITDNGAGGLSSSLGELASSTGGIRLDLSKVPLKYHGLRPWEIFVSESQERMTLVVAPQHAEEIKSYAKKRDVELSMIGTFTDSGYLEIFHANKPVALIGMEFMHDGCPAKTIEAEWLPPKHPEPDFPEPASMLDELKKLLSTLNICSKEYIIRPYDHEVKGGTIIKPLSGIKNDGPSDASVMAPEIGKHQALVVGHGICPRYSDIDAYHMSACAFDEMVRNIVATGGKVPDEKDVVWSVNDNFCCPDSLYDPKKNPDGKLKFGRIVRAAKALYDYSTAYRIPLTSGKDSMKNDFKYTENGKDVRISIPLTLLYSGVCKIEDYRRCVTIDVKKPGDIVYVLGITRKELGGSEYYNLHGALGNIVPKLDASCATRLYRSLGKAMDHSLVESCHDCSDGGLGVALAESAFSGGYGMELDLSKVPQEGITRNDELMFSESQSRFVATVRPQNREMFEKMMGGNIFSEIGTVTEDASFRMKKLDGTIESTDLRKLKEAWQKPLRFDLPLEDAR